MDPRNLPARLTTEQVYAFGKIIENGSLVDVSGATYLIAPLSPMTVDFLKAARLPEFTNNIRINRAEAAVVSAVRAGQQINDAGITLKELSERFLTEQKGRISPTNYETFQRVFRYLFAVIGPDKRVKTIEREDLLHVREWIADIPLWYPVRFKGLTLEQAIERARRDDLQRISLTSVNHHLIRISTIFNWAERQWLIDRNPAKRLTYRANRSKAGFKRRPFSTEQLNVIFHAPIFTGCVDDRVNFKKPGPNHPRNERFWVPLIGLFSGLRVNEICQMEVADLKEVEGVLCFHITNVSDSGHTDKRLKTPSAERYVPVHSELMRIGFGAYFQQARQENRLKLFPKFNMNAREEYAHSLSIWFSQLFLKSLNIYSRETTFHSFRHCFRDALRRANSSLYVLRELCGWSLPQPGLEFGYGSLLTMSDLADAIETVRYPGLNLGHLYSDECRGRIPESQTQFVDQ